MRVLLVIIALLTGTAVVAGDLFSVRKPILIDYGASPRLAVVFNHDTHKSVKCRICHHIADEQGKRFIKCTQEGCHSIKGSYQREPMSAFMAFHARGMDRSCYGCHLEERATHPSFRGCQPCHMGPLTKAALQKAEASPEQKR